MKKTFIWIGSVIGAGAVMSLIFNALEKPSVPRTINVSGECLTSAPKDRTAITLRVTTLDKNAAKSMKMATTKMADITNFLKTQDVKMQTTEFNSFEKTEWNHVAQKSENLGIETRIAVEVSSANPDTIENILNKFAGQPDIYTENLRMFTSTETLKPILEKCLGAAVENARSRANTLAKADNQRTGKLLSVSYDNISYNERPFSNYRLMSAKSMAMDTGEEAYAGGGIVSKDTEITVTVSATFEIR